MQPPATYRGRFAPTPSGPLHLGSLLTALAGFLQARQAGGNWLIRIDDLDAQRSRRDQADTILRQLEAHGLFWDETVRWQSAHIDEYEAAYRSLDARARLYACTCTRATLAAESASGPDGPVYIGTCRKRKESTSTGAMRIVVETGQLLLVDPWQALITRDIEQDVGDFVLRRSDGQIGYQLACVVDEAAQGITQVVRGSDLIGSSLRQVLLQQKLALTSPGYRHLPVLLDDQGRKLSKQNHAAPLENSRAAWNVFQCLSMLRQNPPAALSEYRVEDVLSWATANWQPVAIPHARALPAMI